METPETVEGANTAGKLEALGGGVDCHAAADCLIEVEKDVTVGAVLAKVGVALCVASAVGNAPRETGSAIAAQTKGIGTLGAEKRF